MLVNKIQDLQKYIFGTGNKAVIEPIYKYDGTSTENT